MKTIAYAAAGRVMVFVGSAVPPDAAEWAAYAAMLREHANRYPTMCSMVFTGSGRPSAMQRKQVTDLGLERAKSAVIIESAAGRGVVVLLSWFIPLMKPFSPNELVEACGYLGLSPTEQKSVLETGALLRKELGLAVSA